MAQDPSPHSTHGAGLAPILQLGLKAHERWRPEELAAVLQYHLSAPLEVELGVLPPGQARQLRDLAVAERLVLRSPKDLFEHPLPPLELLRMIKDAAKSCLGAVDAPLPKEVAAVLYYLSIGVAMVRRNERISNLSDAELRQGLDWALALSWLESSAANLLREARRVVAETPA